MKHPGPGSPRFVHARVMGAGLVAVFCAAVLAACAPPPPTNGPNTQDGSGGTTPGNATACVAGAAGDANGMATTEVPGGDDPLAGRELGDAVNAAIADATVAGNEVALTTMDADGRPLTHAVDPTRAALAAALLSLDTQSELVSVGVDPVATAAGDVVPERGTDPYRSQQWALDTLAFENTWATTRGAGIAVAVIDTGVDHYSPEFDGRLDPGVSMVLPAPSGQQGSDGRGDTDPNGHGTHVAGIIAAAAGNGVGTRGVAPEVRIVPVKVLDASGVGNVSDVANGIIWAVDSGHAKVINLSLSVAQQVPFLDWAIDYAADKGVTLVAAAGNEGPNSPTMWPAAHRSVIAVASSNQSGGISNFSSRGCYVDVTAPGDHILSTYPGGSPAFMSGTSMAAPHVAGLAALIRAARPSLRATGVRTAIESTASDRGSPGRDPEWGRGLIDPVGALATASAMP